MSSSEFDLPKEFDVAGNWALHLSTSQLAKDLDKALADKLWLKAMVLSGILIKRYAGIHNASLSECLAIFKQSTDEERQAFLKLIDQAKEYGVQDDEDQQSDEE